MMAFRQILTLSLVVSFFLASAQQGTLRGTIKDAALQEGLPFSTVQVKGTTNGNVTDFEGDYVLKLDPGTYIIQVSFIGYNTIEVTDVVINSDEVTILNASLEEETQMMEAVVVTAAQINNTEAAILNVQKKSANLLDGISSQNFKKIGDNNVAAAVQRVPGVSVQGGKYVFVRGLGDRYTKSVLNGVDIPGLDPDRNTVQMDIFPTNLIDNILVVKSSTADIPADFTGGMVNIVTKDFPEERTWAISLSTAYNPSMHLNSNYLTHKGSSTDWLGFDNGLRDDPQVDPPSAIGTNIPAAQAATDQFTSTLATERTTSPINGSFGLSGGDQINFDRLSIGYNTALSYRNTTEFYEGFVNGEFFKTEDQSENGLRENRQQIGDLGTNNVLLSALIGTAIKTERSKINLNFMHLQNGETRTGYFQQKEFINQSNELQKENLEYSQRAITNFLIAGKHSKKDASFDIEWKFAPTISKIEDKDIRVTPFRTDGGRPAIESSETGDPTRIWRNLDETNYVGRLDFTKKYELLGDEAKFKFGGYYTYKDREYGIPIYRYLRYQGDVEEITQADQVHAQGYISNTTDASNFFQSQQQNVAAYASNEFRISNRLRTVLGLRMEQYNQWYTGQDQQYAGGDTVGGRFFDDVEILDLLDFFPSMNLIYELSDQSNLRFSYSRTIARPSFKEISLAQIFDPVSGRTFIGNIDLQETDINNFDFRWELFQQQGQMFAISGFFKTFNNPIEIVAFSDAAPEDLTPRNVGEAIVYGTELEMRKNLGFLSPALQNFSFNLNATILQSRQQMDLTPGGEFDSRVDNARETENIDQYRQLQGQSPFMLNTGINYDNYELGLQGGLFYNVQGRRLQVVGVGAAPDVFEMPFNSLNFNLNKKLGEEEKHSIGLGVNNILNDDQESRYRSWDGAKYVLEEENVFSFLSPGRRFTLRYSFTF
ncbi:MAG: TonB-dependent receptor [Cyclobacteriaceae bacterium]|jgi:TonB-dependent receptor